jgi:N-acetylmuramoyl-L-alanine amidase
LVIPSFADSKVKITKVEAIRSGAYDQVDVYTSQNIKPEVIMLESPNRIALAFHNSMIDEPVTLPGPSPLIRLIQASQFDDNTVYVIVEPNQELSYEYAYIIGKNKFNLEFSKAKPGAENIVTPSISATLEVAAAPTEEAEPTAEAWAPPEIVPEIKEVKVATPEIIKPKPVEVSKIPLPLEGKTIVIDAGHGGRDPGYVGKSGIFEKFLNLKIALKLEKLLKDAGAKVIMTRIKDVSTKDRAIVAIANGKKADLFVDIHLNCYFYPRIGGTETYYFNPQSKKFAGIIQKALCQTIKTRNRGIKKVTYYTIHHTKMPSVLVEAVYLTNPKEEKLILQPEFQSRVAYGMYKGIKEYVKISSWQRSRK